MIHIGNGTFECGQCTCNEGRYGNKCQCSGEDVKSDGHKEACIRPNPLTGIADPGESVCSGHGDCVCGNCHCTEKVNLSRSVDAKTDDELCISSQNAFKLVLNFKTRERERERERER